MQHILDLYNKVKQHPHIDKMQRLFPDQWSDTTFPLNPRCAVAAAAW